MEDASSDHHRPCPAAQMSCAPRRSGRPGGNEPGPPSTHRNRQASEAHPGRLITLYLSALGGGKFSLAALELERSGDTSASQRAGLQWGQMREGPR